MKSCVPQPLLFFGCEGLLIQFLAKQVVGGSHRAQPKAVIREALPAPRQRAQSPSALARTLFCGQPEVRGLAGESPHHFPPLPFSRSSGYSHMGVW